MAFGEIYIKLAVDFPDDPKVRALARYGPDAGLARDLYVQMVLYCKRLLTDGFVPAEQVGLLVYPLSPDHGNQLAKQLASVGLINELSNGEAQGWQVCAYLKRNGSKEDVERLSKVRAEAGRAGGRKSRKRPAQRSSQAAGKQVGNQSASKQDPIDRDRDIYTDASNEASVDAAQAPPRRGTRIPGDFKVTAEMVAWATQHTPHVNRSRETDKFINYWQAKSGKDATKVDWAATWRNWMLNAAERTAPPGHTPANGQPLQSQISPRDQWMYDRA